MQRWWKSALINLVFWPSFAVFIVLGLRITGSLTELFERGWCYFAAFPEACSFSHQTGVNIQTLIGLVLICIGAWVTSRATQAFKRWRAGAPAGPKGTGELIENVRWWYWDDCVMPGLVKDFDALQKKALSREEIGSLAVARLTADTRSARPPPGAGLLRYWAWRKHGKKLDSEVSEYRKKLTDLLESEATEFRASQWIMDSWEASGVPVGDRLEILKAYFNVLSFWGYPFEWRQLHDEQGKPTMLLIRKRSRELELIQNFFDRTCHGHQGKIHEVWMDYAARPEEIERIDGRPDQFKVTFKNAVWGFDCRLGDLMIEMRTL